MEEVWKVNDVKVFSVSLVMHMISKLLQQRQVGISGLDSHKKLKSVCLRCIKM